MLCCTALPAACSLGLRRPALAPTAHAALLCAVLCCPLPQKDRLSLKEASAKKIKEASAKGLRLGAEAGAAVGEAAAHFGRLLEGLGR